MPPAVIVGAVGRAASRHRWWYAPKQGIPPQLPVKSLGFSPLWAASASHLLFRKRSKNIGLRAGKGERLRYGNLPFRSKSRHAGRRAYRLRRCRLYELFPHI